MAHLLRADGTAEKVIPEKGEMFAFSLEELQGYVGGYIEIVYLRVQTVVMNLMVIDEEGKLKGKPINERATTLARFAQAIFPNDVIVGDALLCDPEEID